MIKASITLQDLRRKIYLKAKAERKWRFWGLYVHISKMETLQAAYFMARKNRGAAGVDGVTFEAIEEAGLEAFLKQIQCELVSHTYYPLRNRRKEIPKGKGKVRVLGIPSIRDRVVQGAVKLILEPIFEAGFQDGSYGYRPGRTVHAALDRVAKAAVSGKTRIIDVDLKAYFDNIRHHILLRKVARRVSDDKVMGLLKLILKASGKRGVPQGGVISPLLANIYLNEVDRILEEMKQTTRQSKYFHLEYTRFADDLVILVDGFWKWAGLTVAVHKRLLGELKKLDVQVNKEKTRMIDFTQDESFYFLGFDFRRIKTRRGRWGLRMTPRMKARTALLRKLREIFSRL